MSRQTPWLDYLETAPSPDHENRVLHRVESLLHDKRSARSRRFFLGWLVAPAGVFASILVLFKYFNQQGENPEDRNEVAAFAPTISPTDEFDLFLNIQNEDIELLAELDLLEDIEALENIEDWDKNSSEEES